MYVKPYGKYAFSVLYKTQFNKGMNGALHL